MIHHQTGTLTEEGLDMWGVVPARPLVEEVGPEGRELQDLSQVGEERPAQLQAPVQVFELAHLVA